MLDLVAGMLKDFLSEDLIYLTPKEGIPIFDQASYKLITPLQVPEATYRGIYTQMRGNRYICGQQNDERL